MPALRNLIYVAVLTAVTLLAYWPSTVALWSFWDQYGGHGPLIAGISAWLIVRARGEFAQAMSRPSPWGCAALLVCSVASVIFWRAAIQGLHLVVLPMLMFLAVLAAYGRGAARVVAFPLGYLYFALPPWYVLTAPLQSLTIRAVAVIAPLIGIPITVTDSYLRLPGDAIFEVTPLCSGVNFLVVGLALAALIGELQGATLRRRAALLTFMTVLAITGNWLRVLIIVLAGYTSGMRHVLVTRGHLVFGWVWFALIMLGFALLVARRPRQEQQTASLRPPAPPSAALQGVCAAAGLLIAMPLSARMVPMALNHPAGALEVRMPPAPRGWRGPLAPTDVAWKPEFVGAHSEWHVMYRDREEAAVELMMIGYASQEQDRELVNENNSLLGSGDLTARGPGGVVRGASPHIEYLAVDAQQRRFLIWSVYDIGGRAFVTPLFSQLWYGLRALRVPPYSVLFAYRTECEPSCDAARARLASFAHSVVGGITIVRAPATPTVRAGSVT